MATKRPYTNDQTSHDDADPELFQPISKKPKSVTYYTQKGQRGKKMFNEDRFIVEKTIPGEDDKPDTIIYGVCDGHGGHYAADYVSKHIANKISEKDGFNSQKRKDLAQAVVDGFSALQTEMKEVAKIWPRNEECNLPSTAGTTVSLVILRGNDIFTAWVGDSPVFFVKVDKDDKQYVYNVTVDHNLKSKSEAVRVIRNGGTVSIPRNRVSCPANHPGALRYPVLSMTRAMGNFWAYNPVTKCDVVSHHPAVKYNNICRMNDLKKLFIVIGTDGLTELCSKEELGQTLIANVCGTTYVDGKDPVGELNEYLAPYPENDDMNYAAKLVKFAANKAATFGKQTDDISCIVLEII